MVLRSNVARSRPPTPASDRAVLVRAPEEVARYLEDAAHFTGGHGEAVGRPRTEADVSDLVRDASRLLTIGAQSSVTGGATPDGGVVLSTERLTATQDIGPDHIRVGAGVSLGALEQRLAERGQWYPPAPTFMGAFMGGVVSTNAAGAAARSNTGRPARGLTA